MQSDYRTRVGSPVRDLTSLKATVLTLAPSFF